MAIIFLLALIFSSGLSHAQVGDKPIPKKESGLKTYVICLERPKGGIFAQSLGENVQNLNSWYESFLPSKIGQHTDLKARILYSYQHVLTGFAARLTEGEVKLMSMMDGFVSARPEKILHLHTTHSPDFLGLQQGPGFWKGSNFGKGVIIGVLDTGVLPSHPSFNDEGMPPPPPKWRGKCEFDGACNNKLIGARNFNRFMGPEPPIDKEGHGSHTASTAAGNFVKDANVFGNANGTAVGVAPLAHLAIYKVCTEDGCAGSDILAALDAAIDDGVDVLSLSLGSPSAPFHDDPVALGSFAAIGRGIFVSSSAGNSGPGVSTLSNEAPWLLTVGASTMDRTITATVKLGNGEEIEGESLFHPSNFASTQLPLVYAGAHSASSAICGEGSLAGVDVKGKVVLCERGGGIGRVEKGMQVKEAGGVAMILANTLPDGFSLSADPHVIPASHVSYMAGKDIKSYISSTPNPTATIIFKGTIIGNSTAPELSSFSSRGPSLSSPGILKPDIIGPGVSILAAWPRSVDNITTPSTFNIISGTSMSCPHLSGIVALLKSSHPDWSPAAIKSALMTTANPLNFKNKPILNEQHQPANLFAVGAGHVNPAKANDPGLVYDIQPADYIPYLCGLGYNVTQITSIVRSTVVCTPQTTIPEAQLNYPSFSVPVGATPKTFTRVVTNVGDANSVYRLKISAPQGVDVRVTPANLNFISKGQKQTYTVTFARHANAKVAANNPHAEGSLEWVSAKYSVRSPIVVKFE